MRGPNQAWSEIMQRAAQSTEGMSKYISKCPSFSNPLFSPFISELKNNQTVVKSLSNILKTNVAICAPLGKTYAAQLSGLYRDMLNVYRVYSEVISHTLEKMGANATGNIQIRLMRRVKRQVLVLISTYVDTSQDAQHVPQLMQAVLVDYPRCSFCLFVCDIAHCLTCSRSIPEARDHEVLKLICTACSKLGNRFFVFFSVQVSNSPSSGPQITQAVPQMFNSVFQVTLNMLVKNFTDYPDHRQAFYAMLEAIVQHQYPALLMIAKQSQQHLKLVVDSIIYGRLDRC